MGYFSVQKPALREPKRAKTVPSTSRVPLSSTPREASTLASVKVDQGIQELKPDLDEATSAPSQREDPSLSSTPEELNLGEHVIQSLDEQWQLRVTISLASDQANFIRFAGALRGKLIEMVYFLVSRRAPEGLRSLEGEERLRSDLQQRFKNVLRGFEFTISIDQYIVENKGGEEYE